MSSAAPTSSPTRRPRHDSLQVISSAISDTQQASCWISVNRSGKTAYVSNTGSGTISSYAIDADGALTLLNAVAANPGGAPIDSALSRDSQFLYVVESAQSKALIFKASKGALTPIGMVPVPAGSQGIAAH